MQRAFQDEERAYPSAIAARHPGSRTSRGAGVWLQKDRQHPRNLEESGNRRHQGLPGAVEAITQLIPAISGRVGCLLNMSGCSVSALQAWAQSKQGRITRIINPDGTELIRQEPPDPRWLSGMLAVAKETSTFLGIREGADTVARMEVPDSTKQALAPMSPDAYMAMLASTGGLSAVNAVPPTQKREGDDAIPVACLDQQAETDEQCLNQLGETEQDATGSQLPRKRRFIHPRLG